MTIGAIVWVIVKKNKNNTYYFKHIDRTKSYVWTSSVSLCKFFFNEDEALIEWNNIGSPGTVISMRF